MKYLYPALVIIGVVSVFTRGADLDQAGFDHKELEAQFKQALVVRACFVDNKNKEKNSELQQAGCQGPLARSQSGRNLLDAFSTLHGGGIVYNNNGFLCELGTPQEFKCNPTEFPCAITSLHSHFKRPSELLFYKPQELYLLRDRISAITCFDEDSAGTYLQAMCLYDIARHIDTVVFMKQIKSGNELIAHIVHRVFQPLMLTIEFMRKKCKRRQENESL